MSWKESHRGIDSGGGITMTDLVLRNHAALARRLGDPRRGATAVEYGLMLALVAAVCIAAISLFGDANSTLYAKLAMIAGLLH